MTRKVIENASLAMQRGSKLELVSHIDHSHFFLGFYENIQVIIRGVKTRYLIFIVELGDHDLVLDQLFLNLVKFSINQIIFLA